MAPWRASGLPGRSALRNPEAVTGPLRPLSVGSLKAQREVYNQLDARAVAPLAASARAGINGEPGRREGAGPNPVQPVIIVPPAGRHTSKFGRFFRPCWTADLSRRRGSLLRFIRSPETTSRTSVAAGDCFAMWRQASWLRGARKTGQEWACPIRIAQDDTLDGRRHLVFRLSNAPASDRQRRSSGAAWAPQSLAMASSSARAVPGALMKLRRRACSDIRRTPARARIRRPSEAAPEAHPNLVTTRGRRKTRQREREFRIAALQPRECRAGSSISLRCPCSPWLRPTPRKLKRSTTAPVRRNPRARRYTTLLCMVPPYSGCGWHSTTASPGASPGAGASGSSSRASRLPAGPAMVCDSMRRGTVFANVPGNN